MKLILHIGSPKTGTSSIQETLYRNRTTLAENGVLYPTCLGRKKHSILSVPYRQSGPPRELWSRFGRGAEAGEGAEQAWAEVASQVREADCQTVVLSGEDLMNVADMKGFTDRLRSVVPAEEIEVVCYLREPMNLYPSSVQQIVKASSKLPRQPYRPVFSRIMNFRNLGPITLREFNRKCLHDGDVVADFLKSFVGVKMNEKAELKNEGLTAEGAAIIQDFRRNAFPKGDNQFNVQTINLVKKVRMAEAKLGGRKFFGRPRLTEFARLVISDAAKQDVDDLQREFGFAFSEPLTVDAKVSTDQYRPTEPVSKVLQVDGEKLLALYGAVVAKLAKLKA